MKNVFVSHLEVVKSQERLLVNDWNLDVIRMSDFGGREQAFFHLRKDSQEKKDAMQGKGFWLIMGTHPYSLSHVKAFRFILWRRECQEEEEMNDIKK